MSNCYGDVLIAKVCIKGMNSMTRHELREITEMSFNIRINSLFGLFFIVCI